MKRRERERCLGSLRYAVDQSGATVVPQEEDEDDEEDELASALMTKMEGRLSELLSESTPDT